MSSTSPGTLIGYARAADEQSLKTQTHALADAGCARIFQHLSAGSASHSPELDACLDYLRTGDSLVVWRLDRLGQSLPRLVQLIQRLHDRHVGFRSLVEDIDTTAPAGEQQLKLFRALADSERAFRQERTRGGLAAARARGRKSGRPAILTLEKLNLARKMLDENQHTIPEIAAALAVSRSTLYRHIATARRQHATAPADHRQAEQASHRRPRGRSAHRLAPAPRARRRLDRRTSSRPYAREARGGPADARAETHHVRDRQGTRREPGDSLPPHAAHATVSVNHAGTLPERTSTKQPSRDQKRPHPPSRSRHPALRSIDPERGHKA